MTQQKDTLHAVYVKLSQTSDLILRVGCAINFANTALIRDQNTEGICRDSMQDEQRYRSHEYSYFLHTLSNSVHEWVFGNTFERVTELRAYL